MIIDAIFDLLTILLATIAFLLNLLSSSEFWIGVSLGVLLVVLALIIRQRRYGFVSANLNLPWNLGNITFEASNQDRRVAWQLYIQLKTRKAALPFDEEFDVIAEVYDSLRELFPIIRELLSNLPLHEIIRQRGIAGLVLRVQNDGLRPHLTRWQADFRRWWEQACNDPANRGSRPQDIQRTFANYNELVNDLRQMNVELNKYAEDLLKIAKAEKQKVKELTIRGEQPIQ